MLFVRANGTIRKLRPRNILWKVCIDNAEALAKLLPSEPCLNEGCTCSTDGDCVSFGSAARCVACNCLECPVSVGSEVINPPLTFVIDTTRSDNYFFSTLILK